MTGGLQTSQPMMRSFTMPNLVSGGSVTQKVLPYPWPATKTLSTSPDAMASPAVLNRYTDQGQHLVRVMRQSPDVSHVRLEDGEEASMKRETPLVKELSPDLRSSNCGAGTQARDIYRQISPHQKPLSVSPSPIFSGSIRVGKCVSIQTKPRCSMADEFNEPGPTTYGHRNVSEIKEPVPTTYGCRANSPSATWTSPLHGKSMVRTCQRPFISGPSSPHSVATVREPLQTTSWYNYDNEIKKTVLVTHAECMPNEFHEPVPTTYGTKRGSKSQALVPTTCKSDEARELKELVPATYGCNKTNKCTEGVQKLRTSSQASDCEKPVPNELTEMVPKSRTCSNTNDLKELVPSTYGCKTADDLRLGSKVRLAGLKCEDHNNTRSLSANLLGQVATNSSFLYASPWAIRDPSAAHPLKIGQPPPVKLVVFDFDCTLSVFHVFASLAGGQSNLKLPVPAPHARTERGQLRRLTELDAHPDWGPGVFALNAFGGKERVAQLRKALEALARKGVECIVCSRGFVGPIRKCLDQVNLLTLFSRTLGNLGNRFGTSSYDEAAARSAGAEHYLGSLDMDVGAAGAASKAETVTTCMTTRGLKWSQVIYLDDDINEVESSSVQTIHVAGENGIGDAELQLLRVMVDGGCPYENDTTPFATPSTTASSHSSGMCEEASYQICAKRIELFEHGAKHQSKLES